ncbi:MAG: bifunctional folylpolyglutamate synthase/dihydrofolate synthase [Bacteroidales bacterium]|jgi:dihydrofolate synthase/folylpolyglutamate synthase|nr:bifunctional folylpolyglutamate synthase/dihydrofolate synthase [Bacteroidales bacterium]
MTYKQTLDFLYSQLPAYHRIGKAAYKNNLDNTLALDEYFGHPHLSYKTIHIAGTNGKGSVSHMVASILQEAGCKTGLYTSPHLKDFRERIRVNGRMIPKNEVTAFIKNHKNIIEEVKPSFFEMTVAMAFDYFAREKVEVAVIEVGLGGRLDSTNIINPVLSVITNIGHDHMDLLGNSIEKVAIEKAGIIKKHVPVVIGETQTETNEVFVSRASETGSPIFFADKTFKCTLLDWDPSSNSRKYIVNNFTAKRHFNGSTPLGGDYQQRNLQTVYRVCEILKPDFKISEGNIRSGVRKVISNTGLMGRWQVIGKNPLTICDTGHNKEGLEYVIRQLKMVPSANLHMVIGFVSDKDLSQILPMLPADAHYYYTKAKVQRALDEKILRDKAEEYGLSGDCYPGVKEALKKARSVASVSDLVFVGGSSFVVAEVL